MTPTTTPTITPTTTPTMTPTMTPPPDTPGQHGQQRQQQPWDDVFLQAPPHPLPSAYLSTDYRKRRQAEGHPRNPQTCMINSFLSKEIVGTLKSVPEDFVVQEIMDWRSVAIVAPAAAADLHAKDTSNDASSFPEQQLSVVQVAFLDEPFALPTARVVDDHNDSVVVPLDAIEAPQQQAVTTGALPREGGKRPSPERKQQELQEQQLGNTPASSLDWDTAAQHPRALLEQILMQSGGKLQVIPAPHALVPVLQGFQAKVLQSLVSAGENNSGEATVATTYVATDEEMVPFTVHGDSSREERGRLHAWVRAAFGLLHTTTAAVTQEMAANETVVQVTADKRFLGLAPFVHSPIHSLPPLYAFYRRGHGSPTHQKRNSFKRDRNAAWQSQSHVFLPLKKELERSQRKQIHQLLKDASGQQWTTNTISQHIVDQRTTTAAIVANWSARASRKRQRVATPAMIHVFVVRKSNVEHRMAVDLLARALDCSQGDIQWAGIKDRQAITYQFCSVNHVPISRIRTAHSKLSAQGIALGGPIRHVTEPLRKGQAKGNRFTIVVRNVRQIHVQEDQNGQTKEDLMHCQKEKMKTAVERLQLTGFLNLYGQQRIGPMGAQVRSVDVGRALLQHDFGRVIDLTMRMATDASSLRVRNVWVESRGDPKMTSKALSKGKGGQRHQRAILHAMQREGTEDPMRTVQCLSHSERTFWINSYQAFVWNSVAAERIRLYGSDQVVVGDLVAAEAKHPPIRVLSPEMASKYAIHHVVLPLPGYTVEYPSNAVATVYENILSKDKIVFRKDAPLDSTAKGSYRPLVVTVPRLEHVWIAGTTTSPPACRLTFDLRSGAYATSLLRELMYTTVERGM